MAHITVTGVFYACEENGLMCRIDLQGPSGQPVLLVAPIARLAFDPAHQIAQDNAAYLKRRADAAAVNSLEDR